MIVRLDSKFFQQITSFGTKQSHRDETSYFKLGAVGKGLNWTMSNSIGGHLTSEGLLMASFISGGLSDCVPLSH